MSYNIIVHSHVVTSYADARVKSGGIHSYISPPHVKEEPEVAFKESDALTALDQRTSGGVCSSQSRST
jgi:hypothetical protein